LPNLGVHGAISAEGQVTAAPASATAPLAGLRILNVATGIAGAYATKLLTDGGADVVKVEHPSGDPWRTWSASDSPANAVIGAPLFQFLHHGQRSVVAAAGDHAILDRLAVADVLIAGSSDALSDAVERRACDERTVRLSITPYGASGPYSLRVANEFTIQADAGSLLARGRAGEEPIQASGRITEFIAGAFGAVAVAAALREARRTGRGQRIDLSIAECTALATSNYAQLKHALLGGGPLESIHRTFETPSIEPTLDGYVGFTANSREQFDNFLLLIERSDLIGDEDLAAATGRQRRWEEWNEIVHGWTRVHTTGEVVERAGELRIPVAPVNSGAAVAMFPHLVDRAVFRTDPTGRFLEPRRPWLVDGNEPPRARPAPTLGEHTRIVAPSARVAVPTDPGVRAELPLRDIRILDLTNWWAGPFGTGVLAALGADVIHVESPTRPDGMRSTGGRVTTEGEWWELSSHFLCVNSNKRSLVVDLSSVAGRAIVLRIIEHCDLVIENFSPRVLDSFELGWDVIRARNPRCSLVRMPAFGLSGPWRDNTGFAQTMEQLSGMAWTTGHQHDQPRVQGGPSDPNAGLHGALASILTLMTRDRTDRGSFVEAAMIESALNVSAEQVIEYSAHGVVLERMGNRAPNAAPQGAYRCAGADTWLAMSVETEPQWSALRQALGEPEWAQSDRFDTFQGRRDAHDELDDHLRNSFERRDGAATVDALLAAGVPAALARDPRALYDHPQMVARRFYEAVEHDVAGRISVTTVPFRFDGLARWIRSPAPRFGQHNRDVLSDLAGLDDDAIAALYDEGIIADTPPQ
jgi:crotonobetainyl-CoA:carnitine CoA-transferase CaiB-like acyl-CoA transferase